MPSDQKETLTFDGEGRAAKRVEERTTYLSPTQEWNEPKYFLYSSVTGQKISEIDDTGRKKKTSVFMGSSVIAEESCHNETCGYIEFKHTDPLTGSSMQTDPDGSIPEYDSGRTELNATGDHIPTTDPEVWTSPQAYSKGGSTHNPEFGHCAVDGALQSDWRLCGAHLASGVGEIGPLNPRVIRRFPDGREEILPIDRGPDGYRYWARDYTCVAGPDGRDCGFTGEAGWVNVRNDEKGFFGIVAAMIARSRERERKRRECDNLLRALFGGPNSVVASIYEPSELVELKDGKEVKDWRAGADRSQTEFAGGLHVYGDAKGRASSPLFVPANDDGSAPKLLRSFTGESSYSNKPVTFTSGRYPEANNPGSFSNRFLYGYKDGLTILSAHVAGAREGQFLGPRNAAGSYQIGSIGGPGGGSDGGYYVHSHLSFWRNGKKINPRTEFCGAGY